MTEIPKTVTRIDIVGSKSGRLGEFWADEWDVYVQDDGRTIKFFARGDGGKAHSERNASLGKDLVGGMQSLRVNESELTDVGKTWATPVEDWHGKNHSYPRTEPF